MKKTDLLVCVFLIFLIFENAWASQPQTPEPKMGPQEFKQLVNILAEELSREAYLRGVFAEVRSDWCGALDKYNEALFINPENQEAKERIREADEKCPD